MRHPHIRIPSNVIFQFDVNNTQVISGIFSTLTGETISVDWGDGSTRSEYSGTDQVWSKDYGSAVNRTVKIYNATALTKYEMDASGADVSFDIANLPTSLTYFSCTGNTTVLGDIASLPTGLTFFRCYGNNTVLGDIANLPTGLTHFFCYGSNTVLGDIANLPTGLTFFSCTGSNTVLGDIANLPTSLTYFRCEGSNTVLGDIANLPTGLTYFRCYGNNTVLGDIANLPTGLTYFYCRGDNTVLGDIANLPTGLTFFSCTGSNTVLGDIANLPTSLTFFRCEGFNTVSDYTTPHTWTTKPATCIVVPTGIGGLSTAEVDNLLIDFDADLVWATDDVITLTGTNAARSSASDAAVSNMVAEGATVTTN